MTFCANFKPFRMHCIFRVCFAPPFMAIHPKYLACASKINYFVTHRLCTAHCQSSFFFNTNRVIRLAPTFLQWFVLIDFRLDFLLQNGRILFHLVAEFNWLLSMNKYKTKMPNSYAQCFLHRVLCVFAEEYGKGVACERLMWQLPCEPKYVRFGHSK